MREEIFDVVNECDEVIDHRPRSEVHRLQLKHRATHVLVFNKRGQLFLQKRSLLKDCFPGTWDSSASGHLDAGEDYDPCAIRELREEIGVHPAPPLRRLFKIDACEETGWEFVWVYSCLHEGPFVLQAEEVDRGDWFTPMAISRWVEERPKDFANSFVFIWKLLRKSGGDPTLG